MSPSLGFGFFDQCLGYSIEDFPEELEDTLGAALREKAALEAENQTAAVPTTLAASATSPPPSPSTVTPLTRLPTTPLDTINEALMDKCRTFVERLRDGAAPWIVQQLNDSYGNMPTDAPNFSFWVALVRFIVRSVFRGRQSRFSPQVLPIDEYEKAKLLPIRSARLRLKLVAHWIDQLNSNW